MTVLGSGRYAKRQAEMIELAKQGYSFTQIAKIIGCSWNTVDKYLANANVASRFDTSCKTEGSDWVAWFKKEWANIYPGDEVREELKRLGGFE